MKRWIGRWLIGVSIIHTIFALIVFNESLLSIINRGVFNTVGTDPMTGAVVWFVLFGLMLFIFGYLVNELEKTSTNKLPKFIAWSLLFMGLLGVVLMPDSGFWLVFPPAIAILIRKS
jgi:hypothetical protein